MRAYIFDENNLITFLIEHALLVVTIMASLEFVHFQQIAMKLRC